MEEALALRKSPQMRGEVAQEAIPAPRSATKKINLPIFWAAQSLVLKPLNPWEYEEGLLTAF